MDLKDFKNDINNTKKSIEEIEHELKDLAAEELSLRQQLNQQLKENEAIEVAIECKSREKDELLEKNKTLKLAWNEIAQSLCTEKASCLEKTKRLSYLLGVSFNVQEISNLVWDIKISADEQKDNNYLVLKYFKEFDKFELVCMKPPHPNMQQIKDFFTMKNDVIGLICTTRNYFKMCATKQLNNRNEDLERKEKQ